MKAAPESGSDRLDANGLARVLLVDDNAANLAALDSVLSGVDLELVTAQSGVEAMKRLLMGDFAVILLDINMPTMDGIQTARLIRERERSRDIPIIFITAYQPDQAQILEGYASGAVDYLIKPVNAEVLRSKVRIFIDLFRKKRQIEWQARQLRAVNYKLQREIEQREAAERDAAFEREERQRVVLASIADAVITTDAQGLVTSLNPVAEQLAGMTAAESKGLPLAAVLRGITPVDLQPLERIVERCAQQRASACAGPRRSSSRGPGARAATSSTPLRRSATPSAASWAASSLRRTSRPGTKQSWSARAPCGSSRTPGGRPNGPTEPATSSSP